MQQIALYFPAGLGDKPRIEYVADVQQIELVERESIETPWPARREGTMVLYRLGAWRRLPRPIRWQAGDVMPAGGRWTTRLALSRATRVQEVALETEAEWRLWEWLRARGVEFQLRVGAVRGGTWQGRVWFELGELRMRWDGVNGFLLRRVGREDRYVGWEDVQRVVG